MAVSITAWAGSTTKPATKPTAAHTAAHATTAASGKKNAHSKSTSSKSKKSKKTPKKHGQQAIENNRAAEIQEALVKAGYLKAEHASGKMDDNTKTALMKLQADNGWQTKVIPDSRALIKLGLGPDQSAIINRDTAALSAVPKAVAEVPDK